MNRFLRLGVAALSLVGARSAFAQDIGIEVGKTAPVVTVQSLDGKDVSLDQFIGKKPVIMEFWATWCPNCRELEPAKSIHMMSCPILIK